MHEIKNGGYGGEIWGVRRQEGDRVKHLSGDHGIYEETLNKVTAMRGWRKHSFLYTMVSESHAKRAIYNMVVIHAQKGKSNPGKDLNM